ncbi:hypothetical protein [Streptodolium elevatio]
MLRTTAPRVRTSRAQLLRTTTAVAFAGLLVSACGSGGDDAGSGKLPFGSTEQPGAAGGVSSGVGKPSSSAPGKGDTTSGKGKIDVRTVDPCSFVAHEALTSYAAAKSPPATRPGASPLPAKDPITSNPGVTYNSCTVNMLAAVGGSVDVAVDLADIAVEEKALAEPAKGATVREANGLRIVSFTHEGDGTTSCQRALVDKDMKATKVDVRGNAAAARADVCAIADAVVEAGSKLVADGGLAVRTYAPKSFVKLRPCDEVSDSALAKVPGLAINKVPNATGFNCSVGPAGNDANATVVLVRVGLRTSALAGDPAKQVQIAGRASTVEYEEAAPAYRLPGRCSVATTGAALADTKSAEIAEVVVLAPSEPNEEKVCAAAKEVAADFWGKLPK